MKRAFKIPTVREEDYFKKEVEVWAESMKDFDVYHFTSLLVYQTFFVPVINGNLLSNFVKVNMN